MSACGWRGSDGIIEVNGNPITAVTWEVTIDTSIITSPRIGKVADMKCPGKQDVNGTVEQVLVTPDLLAMVMGDTDSRTVGTTEVLLSAAVLDDSPLREEITITPNPTFPTNVKVTLTAGTNPIGPGSVVIHGTDVSGNYVTEVLTFSAMVLGDPAQVKYGTQVFDTTTYVDVEAILGVGGAVDPTLAIDGVTGTVTQSPGNATIFSISGEVSNTAGDSVKLTLNRCFFTSGSFPIGDSNTLVACSLPFTVTDADVDFTLSWTV